MRVLLRSIDGLDFGDECVIVPGELATGSTRIRIGQPTGQSILRLFKRKQTTLEVPVSDLGARIVKRNRRAKKILYTLLVSGCAVSMIYVVLQGNTKASIEMVFVASLVVYFGIYLLLKLPFEIREHAPSQGLFSRGEYADSRMAGGYASLEIFWTVRFSDSFRADEFKARNQSKLILR